MAISFREILRSFVDAEYRRLKNFPRYTPTTASLLGKRIQIIDSLSFIHTKALIFKQEIYRFETERESPRILDGGANIGLSTIYFKRLYPKSRITAFEPEEKAFWALEKNLETFGYRDIELVPKALSAVSGEVRFMHEGADCGRAARPKDHGPMSDVPSLSLNTFLDEEIDFLKLDIEGAETKTLQNCRDRLKNVRRIFVEHHSFVGEKQDLDILVGLLTGAGFRLHFHPSLTSPQPFLKRDSYLGIDLALNIFAFRE